MPEYQDIYDIHRNLTGKKLQRGLPRKSGEFILVVHLLLFDEQGRLLVQKRCENKASWCDMWDISVGGIAQAGDDSRRAIEREVWEEIGLQLDFSNTEPVFSFRSKGVFDDYWLAEIHSEHLELKLQPEEVAEVRWVTKQEWQALLATHQVIPYLFQDIVFELHERNFPGARLFPFGNPTHIKGAVFDMDGLLLDTERVCSQTWDEAAKQMHFADAQRAKIACIGLNTAGTIAFFERTYGNYFDYHAFLDLFRTITRQSLEKHIPVKEGAAQILQMLKEKKIALAVASSTREALVKEQLTRAGLIQYFDAIITGDMVQKGKPDPAIYEKAFQALELLPETCIAFEDSVHGIRSAYRAKTYPIHIPDIQPESQETETMCWKKFASLTEASAFLANIL